MKKAILTLALLLVIFWLNPVFAGGNDGFTTLLLHNDDASFADSSTLNHAVTNNGVQADTSVKKFGSASGFFDGADDYLSLEDSNDWNFINQDYTMDCWVRFHSLPAPEYVQTMVSHWDGGLHNDRSWYLAVYNTSIFDPEGAYYLRYDWSWDGSNYDDIMRVTTLTTDNWYHLAVVRSGASLYLFQDGTQVGLPYTITNSDGYNSSTTYKIGATTETGSTYYHFNGWMDEFRVSTGVARWTSDFTPPTEAYTNPVPEPATLSLLGIGLLALMLRRKR